MCIFVSIFIRNSRLLFSLFLSRYVKDSCTSLVGVQASWFRQAWGWKGEGHTNSTSWLFACHNLSLLFADFPNFECSVYFLCRSRLLCLFGWRFFAKDDLSLRLNFKKVFLSYLELYTTIIDLVEFQLVEIYIKKKWNNTWMGLIPTSLSS